MTEKSAESPRTTSEEELEELERALRAAPSLISEVRALRAALEAIVYASDQCRGHRECGHSMEPWRKARELLGLAEDRPTTYKAGPLSNP